LGHVALEVADLERSVAFYCDGLRFDLDETNDGAVRRAWLRAGGLTIVLSEVGPKRRSARGVRLTMEVIGVDAYYGAVVARGVTATPPWDDGEGRSFLVRDPDGYLWEFEQSLS
jgi:catechol 2,3-dioxygenase-like lactoylglutathione lyase family enzyme